MILHIANDLIFINYAIEQFDEVAPGRNIYLILANELQSITYHKKVILAPIGSSHCQKHVDDLSKYEAVCIHALTDEKIPIILSAPDTVKFFWFFLGADGLYVEKIKSKLYSKLTKRYFSKLNSFSLKRNLISYFQYKPWFAFLYKFYKNEYPQEYLKLKAIHRMYYCLPVIKNDYTIISNKLGYKGKHLPFKYGSIDNILDDAYLNINVSENNILVGNSSDPSNNSIDVFRVLSGNLSSQKVYAPLSYGDINFRNFFLETGKLYLGNNFYPLLEFLSNKDYNKIISTCGIIIMNHFRQQGTGSIFLGFYFGARVYLSKRNPFFKYLKNEGFVLFEIEKTDFTDPTFYTKKLDQESIAINKEIVQRILSREQVKTNTLNIIKEIDKFSYQNM